MSFTFELSTFNWQQLDEWLTQFEAMGPIPGILVPMSESFLPFLPLVALIVTNVNAYGFWEGLLLSWIGVVLGSISVFLLVRAFGRRFRGFIERKLPRSEKFIHWVETNGFMPIFILACFPFTPSSVVNIISGLSKLEIHKFAIATLLGKGIMIALVSFAGHDLASLLHQPWKLALIVVGFILLWLIGRKLESKFMK
ncbi:TVP38/TMEM64 family protein [Paenibacillus chartarius]|uniref:TVP38/TMEM64 family membrane protein n=1 Tax=Paenibacillus chartarius TaxID=747481 RepID=A0ABV6DVE1_9BACL